MAHESPNSHDTRRYVRVRRVDECNTIDELLTHCLPAFGGAYLRRIYQHSGYSAIGMGCPFTLAISGPVTVSGQHQTWLIPLLETGWVAYLSAPPMRSVITMAIAASMTISRVRSTKCRSIRDDAALRDEGTIRVTDMAFDEGVLLDQDRFLSAVLAPPEFQHKMTGTELRYRLGEYYARAGACGTACRPDCFRRASGWRFRSSSARRPMAAYS